MTSTLDAPLLDLADVDVRLGRGHRARSILHDVRLSIRPGEIVGIIGETGSGKTTLARTIVGLAEPERGHVRIAGRETTGLSARQRRDFRREGAVQFVFQDPLRSMDPSRTVAQSIAEGLRATTGPAAVGADGLDAAIDEALEQVGLDRSLRNRRPGEISGGQRQRVAIARALACKPSLLICDEPVSALDASNRNKILRLLGTLRDELNIAIIVIAHDLQSLAGIADRVVVLYRGHVVEDGPIHEVFARPRHPYTGLLLASAPTTGERPLDPARLRVVSDVASTPDGCVFAARCRFATDECQQRPQLRPITTDNPWQVACHHDESWWAEARRTR
jgi:oligopeptide/dipeptide ABC transporter ATP-binding protein